LWETVKRVARKRGTKEDGARQEGRNRGEKTEGRKEYGDSKKEEKIDIKNLLQKEIAKAKEGKRNIEEADKNSQDQVARFFEPVVLAVTQLKSELSNNKQIEFRISDHDVEIHLGKNRKVRVEVFRYGGEHKFKAIEEGEYEHPEHHASNGGRHFETSGEAINFLVKICAEFIVNQNE
jgi:hypothetical protein